MPANWASSKAWNVFSLIYPTHFLDICSRFLQDWFKVSHLSQHCTSGPNETWFCLCDSDLNFSLQCEQLLGFDLFRSNLVHFFMRFQTWYRVESSTSTFQSICFFFFVFTFVLSIHMELFWTTWKRGKQTFMAVRLNFVLLRKPYFHICWFCLCIGVSSELPLLCPWL